VSIFLKY